MSLIIVGLLSSFTATGCSDSLVRTVNEELVLASVESTGFTMECEGTVVLVNVDDGKMYRVQLADDARAEVRLAVQLADLLHAREVESRFAARYAAPPIPAVVRPPFAFRGSLSVGAVFSGGGFGVQPSLRGTLVVAWKRIGVGLAIDSTVRAAKVGSSAGSADIGLGSVQVMGELPFALEAWSLSPRVGVGAMLGWAAGRSATFGYSNRTQVAAVLLISAGLSLWRVVSQWLSIGGGLDVGVAPIPVRISVPGSEASLGLPIIGLTVGAQFR